MARTIGSSCRQDSPSAGPSWSPARANELELATNTAGNLGILSGLGSGFVNFSTVMVDNGAYWTLAGTNTVSTLVDAGTLGNIGTIAGTVTLSGAGTLAKQRHDRRRGYGVLGQAVPPAAWTNTGTIVATAGMGVHLVSGGSVSNLARPP